MVRIPGFLPEADPAPATVNYHETAISSASEVAVPQRIGFSGILTHDGGRWCCITGVGKNPICFKVPPPIVIST